MSEARQTCTDGNWALVYIAMTLRNSPFMLFSDIPFIFFNYIDAQNLSPSKVTCQFQLSVKAMFISCKIEYNM